MRARPLARVDGPRPAAYRRGAQFVKERCAGVQGGTGANVQGGTEMGDSKRDARRIVSRVIAAVAVSDLAYRMFMRAPLRRRLGLEIKPTG